GPLVVLARSATEPSSTALMMVLPEWFSGRLSCEGVPARHVWQPAVRNPDEHIEGIVRYFRTHGEGLI
ncbi:MAG TPA: hypothetical protein VF583_14100, partial [Bradyrhizobium sp.]